jgi:hypothetical protein
MPEGISLIDLPQAAIGEIEGGNFAYMVTPDGQPYKVDISQLVAKMRQDAGCGCVQTAKLFIPSAEVLQLNTTPKAFGLNVPSGYAPHMVTSALKIVYAGTPYATNVNVKIRQVGAASDRVDFGNALAVTSDAFVQRGITSGGGELIDGADYEVYVATGDPTAGDSDITLYLTYMLIEL